MSEDDKTLIHRIQNGDTDAFNALVGKYHQRFYGHLFSRVKDVETVKDLTRDTWLKVFRAIDSFCGDAAFYMWVYSDCGKCLQGLFLQAEKPSGYRAAASHN